ncbi:hypothetical protein UA08_04907 [Talaromyces atroroseus]|uniref:Zn(2)-C6 fungal-type domain-containing protein n=1 Tax=Talaromyces atroroseus TaxID=1441469 RepID=A0A225B247_TALAT|nr:hypothetical protein UA08_04907 [Talaromyces atroroseus]OKL59917.1 hypothetical protein UA08_04907 [Talaromyces atroroseus]
MCDRAKPGCERCQKAGLECAGYSADSFVLVVPTRKAGKGNNKVKFTQTRSNYKESSNRNNDQTESGGGGGGGAKNGEEGLQLSPKPSINVAPENRMQVLSYFIERYQPASMTSRRGFVTPSSWIRSLPSLLGRWEILDTALSAVCLAYIGDLHQDGVHLHESQRFYNDVLRKLGSLPLDSIKSANEGVLTTTMTMAMYELFHCSYNGLQGWMFHVQGACRILELRGPPSKESPLDLSLYSRVRITALWDAYGSRKGLFLARREWQNLSDSPHDTLLDLLVCMPGLLETSDTIKSTANQPGRVFNTARVDDLLGHWQVLFGRLLRWYTNFENREAAGLYECGPLQQDSHPYLEADQSHLYSVFPQIISFKDAYVAQIMLLYWFGQLVIHAAMTEIYMIREKHQARLFAGAFPPDYKGVHQASKESVQKAGDYYATKICQSTASLKGGYGFQMVMVPLWAALQFFALCGDPKFDWSQAVFRNFGKLGGFMLAEPLRVMRPTQYPGIAAER